MLSQPERLNSICIVSYLGGVEMREPHNLLHHLSFLIQLLLLLLSILLLLRGKVPPLVGQLTTVTRRPINSRCSKVEIKAEK